MGDTLKKDGDCMETLFTLRFRELGSISYLKCPGDGNRRRSSL